MTRSALVTGGNRGIGLEVCRQLAARGLLVWLGSRDAQHGADEAARLRAAGGDVRAVALDIGDDASVRACADAVGAVDVLVNNAGLYPEADVLAGDERLWRAAVEVNLLGAWRTCRAFVPGMIARGYGRVVNVSSGYGSFGEGLEGPAAYAVSKAALDALTKKLADEVASGVDVKVNAVCPGWVRTRMGGDSAPRSVERGADGVVWAATLEASGPNGGFFRDRRRLPW
jgi:NAD(P)-dependent dehydrogenase (short-subunit alcohol dehydrogenase family)